MQRLCEGAQPRQGFPAGRVARVNAGASGGLEADLSCEAMITSIHTLIYSDDAKATRAFLRDVLGWKFVAEEWDNDWLIFNSGPSEMGVHPTHSVWEGKTYDHPRQH